MRRGGQPGRLRPRRRADRRRSRRAVPRRAHRDRHLRHHLVARCARPSSSAAMEAGAIDIVIGTQLVTKGYHFPNLTLVGVVDADLGLTGGDLRAAERSFQQIQQVAGRAGRGDKPGRVLVQTHDPDAPVIAALVSGDVRRLLRRRDRGPARGGDAAVRPAGRDRRLGRGFWRSRGRRPPHRPRRARSRRHGGVRPRPGAARDASRPPSPAPAGPRPPQPRRPGRHPRLAGRASNGARRSASASTSTPTAFFKRSPARSAPRTHHGGINSPCADRQHTAATGRTRSRSRSRSATLRGRSRCRSAAAGPAACALTMPCTVVPDTGMSKISPWVKFHAACRPIGSHRLRVSM